MNLRSSLILREVCRVIIPAVMLFGLYVQFHGSMGPVEAFRQA